MRTALLALLLTAPAAAEAPVQEPTKEPVEYAKPELLVEPAELQALLAKPDADVVVLHTATPAIYYRARVPGAVLVDVAKWKAAFGDGTDAEGWGKRIGDTGIGPKTRVIVYDEGVAHHWPTSARVWWILKYWGVEQASILNGGLNAWVAHAGDAIPQEEPEPAPGGFVAKPQPDRLASYGEVLTAAAGDSHAVCVVDSRTDREVAAGRIPTAQHSDWARYVDPETGRLRPAVELKQLLDGVGFDPGRPAVAYCQSGGRASVVAFAMELMGGQQVANYWGSWGEWSRRGGIGTPPARSE